MSLKLSFSIHNLKLYKTSFWLKKQLKTTKIIKRRVYLAMMEKNQGSNTDDTIMMLKKLDHYIALCRDVFSKLNQYC